MRVKKGIPKGNNRHDYDHEHLRRRQALAGIGSNSIDSAGHQAGVGGLPAEEAASEDDDDDDETAGVVAVYLLSYLSLASAPPNRSASLAMV